MFTGIVEALTPVAKCENGDFGLKFSLNLQIWAKDLELGESIAVNGCCLTVEAIEEGACCRFHAGRETLSLTTLDELADGAAVNVERALRMGDRLGGHMVSGHVDGVGIVRAIEAEESQTIMTFEIPEKLSRQVILKGSIAIDGISLTLTSVEKNLVQVALIPHTLEVTSLGSRQVGDRVNVETDMIGKWVAQNAAAAFTNLGSGDSKTSKESD